MRITEKKVTSFLIVAMMTFSSLVVIQFSGRTMFLFMQIAFFIWMAVYQKKLRIFNFALPNLIMISLLCALFSAFFSDIPFSYKKAAAFMTMYEIPLFFSCCYINHEMNRSSDIILKVLMGIRITTLLQLFWIPLQFVAYHVMHIDLNDLFFHRLFHFMEHPSFIRSWIYYPSGFTWHSAVIAPLLILAFVLFKETWVRLLIIVDAAICGSSTALIGVFCCIGILMLFRFFDYIRSKQYVNFKKVLLAIACIAAVLFVAYCLGILDSFIERGLYLISRFTGDTQDASTKTHLGYYSDYWKILKTSSPFQVIFGYGYGCSGYPISKMYGLYANHSNWAVECDIVNILISRGIFGFIVYYLFLAYIFFAGFKVDRRYLAFIVPVMIEGFGYNVQWSYIYMIELLMFCAIKRRISIFDYADQKHIHITRDISAFSGLSGLIGNLERVKKER